MLLGVDSCCLRLGLTCLLLQSDRLFGRQDAGKSSLLGALLCMALGIVILTLLLHAVRWIARGHARLAKALLVEPGA